MKRFLEALMAVKSVAALVFSGQIMVFAAVYGLTGFSDAISLSNVWQALAIAAITASLHYVCFSESVLKKMRYALRIVLFMLPLLLTLAAFAYAFRWFPIDNAAAWLGFVGVYLAVTAVLTAAFELYYRVTGRKYGLLLDSYRTKHAE